METMTENTDDKPTALHTSRGPITPLYGLTKPPKSPSPSLSSSSSEVGDSNFSGSTGGAEDCETWSNDGSTSIAGSDISTKGEKKPKLGGKKKVQFVLPLPPKKAEKKAAEGRKYAQIAPESVKFKAESVGIEELNDDVAHALSEEISYRLREIISKCTVHMRHNKKFKLTTRILMDVFESNDIEYDFGIITDSKFDLVDEEELYIPDDEVVNLDLIASEYLEQRMQDLKINSPKITGRLILPDRKQKFIEIKEKSEAEILEDNKSLLEKEIICETEHNRGTDIESEPLEALGLRKITNNSVLQ